MPKKGISAGNLVKRNTLVVDFKRTRTTIVGRSMGLLGSTLKHTDWNGAPTWTLFRRISKETQVLQCVQQDVGYVLASAVNYAVACWESSINVRDTKRIDKLIPRLLTSLVSDGDLWTSERPEITEQTSLYHCHFHDTPQTSSFSNRLNSTLLTETSFFYYFSQSPTGCEETTLDHCAAMYTYYCISNVQSKLLIRQRSTIIWRYCLWVFKHDSNVEAHAYIQMGISRRTLWPHQFRTTTCTETFRS